MPRRAWDDGAVNLQNHWYQRSLLSFALIPVSWLFCAVVKLRRKAYASGILPVRRFDAPVIVVGNISVGGTGKTPLVIWLVALLREHGYRPGIVSRGYGGHARTWPQQVRPDSDPGTVGDEPVLLAQRCQCPVAVGPDRVAAIEALLAHSDCDVVVSDDGMQHYAMDRTIEVAVVDGTRRFGNGRCLPAGPLREPASRLQDADFVVSNGLARRLEYAMRLEGGQACMLNDPAQCRRLEAFRDGPVHGAAGIGHPERFFSHLRQHGLQVREHAFADHHPFAAGELDFDDERPVLMTEKDAVKYCRYAREKHWAVPVNAQLDPRLGQRLLELLEERHPRKR